jgi:peptidoglycan/xylan/chitin deacetylase (PgdA/CDA1 family)
VVRWTLDPYVGRRTDPAASIARTVAREVGPGSVILLADTAGGAGRATLEALPSILERLERQGYVTVTF